MAQNPSQSSIFETQRLRPTPTRIVTYCSPYCSMFAALKQMLVNVYRHLHRSATVDLRVSRFLIQKRDFSLSK